MSEVLLLLSKSDPNIQGILSRIFLVVFGDLECSLTNLLDVVIDVLEVAVNHLLHALKSKAPDIFILLVPCQFVDLIEDDLTLIVFEDSSSHTHCIQETFPAELVNLRINVLLVHGSNEGSQDLLNVLLLYVIFIKLIEHIGDGLEASLHDIQVVMGRI